MLMVPLGVIISPNTLTFLPAVRLTLPPLSVRMVAFSASVSSPSKSPNLSAVKASETGLRVVSGCTASVATFANVGAPAWFAKPALICQVCAFA